MSKWTPFIVLEGSVNPISALFVNATVISVDLQPGTCELLLLLQTGRQTSKKRQMRISKDTYIVCCKIFYFLYGAASPNLQKIAMT
jgi:hypothetical protein